MKKIVLLLYAMLMCITLQAEKIEFTYEKIHDHSLGNGSPKSPIEPPVVYIEDYTLSFAVDHPDYVLYIKDEDGAVVYTTTVYSTQTQVILPSTLAGDYQIELAMSYWLFTGWINL